MYWLKPKNLQIFSGTDGDPNADLVGIDGGVVSPSGGISLTTSEIGQVWDMPTGDSVSIRSPLSSLDGEQMTWGGWYKPATTIENWWANNYDGTGPSTEQIIRTNNQAAGVFFRPIGWVSTPSISAPLNTWSHIIGVINVTDGYVACYVNGILSAIAASGSTPITTGTQEWVIGGSRAGQFGDQRWYNRALSDNEVHDLYVASRTGYQDQFKRRYFPVSTTVEEPPTEETTGGLIRLKSPKQSQPSYKAGYAKSASESAYPELWEGLKAAWSPELGNSGGRIINAANPGVADGSLVGNVEWGNSFIEWTGSGDSNDRVECGPVDAFAGAFSITVRFWRNASGASRFLISSGDTNIASKWWDLYVSNTDFLKFDFDDNVTKQQGTSTFAVTEDAWNSVTVQREQGGPFTIFLNGIFAGEFGTNGDCNTGDDVWLGDLERAVENNWWGKIGCTQIRTKALTHSEIKLLHADPLAPFRQRRTAIYSTQATTPAFNHWYTRPGRKHRIVGSGVYV